MGGVNYLDRFSPRPSQQRAEVAHVSPNAGNDDRIGDSTLTAIMALAQSSTNTMPVASRYLPQYTASGELILPNPDGSRTEPSGRGYFPGAFNGADVTVEETKSLPPPAAGIFSTSIISSKGSDRQGTGAFGMCQLSYGRRRKEPRLDTVLSLVGQVGRTKSTGACEHIDQVGARITL